MITPFLERLVEQLSKQRERTTALPKSPSAASRELVELHAQNVALQAQLKVARQSGYLDGVNAYAEVEEGYIFPAFNAEKLLERIHVDIVATLTAKHGFIEGALLDVLREKLRALAGALSDADIVNRSWLSRFSTIGLRIELYIELRDLLADALAQGNTRIDANALFQRISDTFNHEQVQDRLAVIRASLKPGRTPDDAVTVITRRAWQMRLVESSLPWRTIGRRMIEEFASTGAHPDALAILQDADSNDTLADYMRRTCNNRKR